MFTKRNYNGANIVIAREPGMSPLPINPLHDILLPAFFKYGLPVLALYAVLQFISARIGKRKKRNRTQTKAEIFPPLQPLAALQLNARRPLTAREEQMFLVLTTALPECTILAQVTFQALLDTSSFEDRNRFNLKSADFVICSKRLTPVAIIELDDSTHTVNKARDEDRDIMLQNAGYQTIRYRDIPTAAKIREDIQAAITRLKAAKNAST